MNAYKVLGLEPRLELSDEALAEAFRAMGKSAHPDAGGNSGDFSELRQAYATLARLSQRLRHFMELRGLPLEDRGPIDDRLMDLFSQVGAASQRAEVVARKREEARSALVRSLTESEAQAAREEVEEALSLIDEAIAAECRLFPEFEVAPRGVELAQRAAVTARNLAFLEKWRSSLRAAFARLV
jgi:curved DNA-binding protein CbpA